MSYGMNSTQAPYTATGAMKEKVPSGYRKASLQNFTPEAMQLYQSLFKHVSPDSYLSRLSSGDQNAFEEMEAPSFRQFNELQGGIASRFSGLGQGARRSSGFQNTMNQAASDFAQDLQSKRQDYMRQALRDLYDMSHGLINERPYENFLVKKNRGQSSGWGGFGGAALGGLGGFLAGGPGGALTGARLGYNLGSQF